MISVTTALKVWSDFSMIRPEVLAYAAARGTAVHAACAAYALGLFVPVLPDDQQGFFTSFKDWFTKYVAEVYFVEQELTDKTLGFYGHPDIGCRLVDGQKLVIDYKTPAVWQDTWKAQCAAYKHLADIKGPVKYDGCAVNQLRKDGSTAKVTPIEDPDAQFSLFLSSLNCTLAWGNIE
jgi:hypothetical protein